MLDDRPRRIDRPQAKPSGLGVERSSLSNGGGLKVLHVLDNLGMGGAETWLMELLRFWHRNGTGGPQFDFLATGGIPTYYDEEAKRYGAAIYYLRYRKSNLLPFAHGFREILRRGRYTAIHDHGDHSAGWHLLMGAGHLPPVRVVHVHNPAFHIRLNYGVTMQRRVAAELGKVLVARYATHITGTSRQAIGEYGFDTPRFKDIPKMPLHCGFDTRPMGEPETIRRSVRAEFDWPQDTTLVLFGGRLDQSSDFDHPLNHKNSAFAVAIGIAAARLDPKLRMIFAGSLSPALPVLEQRIKDAGFAGRIRFLGVRTDLKRLMYASDALLFPSRGEGLGMVAVEAQAAGLPVLASDAVPRECVVVPDLVRFEPLAHGADEWAAALLQHAARPRDFRSANQCVATSPFAIENSARTLIALYKQD